MKENIVGQSIGAVAQENIFPGRFVLFVQNTFPNGADLPGVKLPASAEEAKRARGVAVWPPTNRSTPYFTWNTRPFGLREGGFEAPPDNGLTATVFFTPPHLSTVAIPIPSGGYVAVVTEGVVTIPSGQFIDSPAIRVPGTLLVVETAAPNAGKVKAATAMSDSVVAVTHSYDTLENRLTVKLLA